MSTTTRVMQHHRISPPPGCHASVLLKQVAHEQSTPGNPGQRIYVCWVIASRHSVKAASVAYEHDGVDTIRIDVPAEIDLSRSYLEQQLRAFYEKDPTLPPETPVIKGIA